MSWTTIGIDIGGTKALGVRVTDGEVVEQRRTQTTSDPAELSKSAIEAARALWTEDVSAVGVGVAGLVSWPEGAFVWGPHVPGLRVPVRADLEKALGVPVVVDNDANMAAWGEYHLGAGVGSSAMVLVTLGTGIGGAMVLHGGVYRGASFAGEWGHMPFVPDGITCACGAAGCWETMASGPALARMAREVPALWGITPLTPEAVLEAAVAGNEAAAALVGRVGTYLGRGLCTLVTVLDPDCVVIGGGFGVAGAELLLGPARAAAGQSLHGGSNRSLPPIVTAQLGAAANAIGAALMAHQVVLGDVTL